METRRPDILIMDSDSSRARSFRRILSDARPDLTVSECADPKVAHDTILRTRPTVVMLHTTFPYMAEDGTGLVELLDSDFRTQHSGLLLVLPISGTLLYRSGYQEGLDFLDMAHDIITTDFTDDMVCSVTLGLLDRRVAAAEERETAIEAAASPAKVLEPSYSFVHKGV